MSTNRKARLDALERGITGSKRIALFGHRAVGKTTLLAMFYREASAGRVPGLRLAAVGPSTAEYLAERIGELEGGAPLAGTLAETELKLRLYRGAARLDLIVKDYQGEHVTLGTEAPIQEFFADCDAVLLCLDPETSDRPTDCQRRQQEIEDLLERYIETSDDAKAGRPVALLVTKYDRVLDRGGPPPEQIDDFVDRTYGMTRHALKTHAPHSALFAVSSYGRGVGRDGKPPAELHPMGLEGPLIWLADELETSDRDHLDWLWDLAPDDLPRLSRCVEIYERRYPNSDHAIDFRKKISRMKGRKRRRRVLAALGILALGCGAVAGYDFWGYRDALSFESADNPPAAVERHWSDFLAQHPTHPLIFPNQAREASRHLADWRLRAEQARVEVGIDRPGLDAELQERKIAAPEDAEAIARVEEALRRQQHEKAWKELQVADVVAVENPEEHLILLKKFLRDYPETAHKDAAVTLIQSLNARVQTRRDNDDHQAVDALARAGTLPGAPLRELIEQADGFLKERPNSRSRDEVQTLLSDYTRRLDEQDIEKARQVGRDQPTNFPLRRSRYDDYLKAHKSGGRFVREAMDAQTSIDKERDTYQYRLAYDHLTSHPGDVGVVAARLRSYLDANPDGRFVKEARAFIAWWEQISQPHDYQVTLRRGVVEASVGKYFSGGSPDLSVVVFVGGVQYGPSPVIKDTHSPIWNYTFPRPIRWKYQDPVSIRILDNDWSESGVFTFNSAPGDPLAMKMLAGTVRPSKGGKTELVFSSDFAAPTLPQP